MALRMAVALTSPSSLSVWGSLVRNVAAAPPLDQVLGPGSGGRLAEQSLCPVNLCEPLRNWKDIDFS